MARYLLGEVAPAKQALPLKGASVWLLNLDMVESNTGRIIEYLFVDQAKVGGSTITFDTKNVLYSKLRPYLNKVVVPNRPGFATSEFIPLCPDPNILNRDYLAYFLRSKHFVEYINDKTSGAKMPRANLSDFKAFPIDCPVMSEQVRIVALLQSVSTLLETRRQQLLQLDELIKARFVEMFGDPVTNSKGWPTKRFDEICENLDSRRKPITASEREEGIYPYYGASGVVDHVAGYIFDEDILLVSEDGANLLMRSTPIAFSVSGKVWVNNHAHVVRFESMSLQNYIEVYFSMIDISNQITGSAQPKLNQAKLNAMQFGIPDENLMDEYYEFCRQLDKSKFAAQKALDEAQLLFDSLMQKYFG